MLGSYDTWDASFHIIRVAYIFSEYVFHKPEHPDRLDTIFGPLGDLFSPYRWRDLLTWESQLHVERDACLTESSSKGLDETTPFLLAMKEEQERHVRYQGFPQKQSAYID